MTRPRPAPTRIGHVCQPTKAAIAELVCGTRSSVREVCAHCGVVSQWIRRATDGLVVALAGKEGGR